MFLLSFLYTGSRHWSFLRKGNLRASYLHLTTVPVARAFPPIASRAVRFSSLTTRAIPRRYKGPDRSQFNRGRRKYPRNRNSSFNRSNPRSYNRARPRSAKGTGVEFLLFYFKLKGNSKKPLGSSASRRGI